MSHKLEYKSPDPGGRGDRWKAMGILIASVVMLTFVSAAIVVVYLSGNLSGGTAAAVAAVALPVSGTAIYMAWDSARALSRRDN